MPPARLPSSEAAPAIRPLRASSRQRTASVVTVGSHPGRSVVVVVVLALVVLVVGAVGLVVVVAAVLVVVVDARAVVVLDVLVEVGLGPVEVVVVDDSMVEVEGSVVLLLVVDVVVVEASVVLVVVDVVVGTPSNRAVYVVSEAGVLIVCAWAPPSDQPSKVKDPCGETASIVRSTPTTPLNCTGAVTGWPSRVSWSPDGLVSSRIVEVSGRMNTDATPVRPTESVARRMIS
jgi:hypothetical protein